MHNKLKPLTLEETRLKEEIKREFFPYSQRLEKGQYKKKFDMLCHLEDFEVQYWELDEENKRLRQDYAQIVSNNCDYLLLEQENEKLKKVINKTNDAIDIVIELIKQQPTEDDSWILEKLNGFKYILNEVSE